MCYNPWMAFHTVGSSSVFEVAVMTANGLRRAWLRLWLVWGTGWEGGVVKLWRQFQNTEHEAWDAGVDSSLLLAAKGKREDGLDICCWEHQQWQCVTSNQCWCRIEGNKCNARNWGHQNQGQGWAQFLYIGSAPWDGVLAFKVAWRLPPTGWWMRDSVMDAWWQRMGDASTNDFRDAGMAFETEEWWVL